jgi:hypothetical protein
MSSDSGRFGWHGACQVHTEARNGYGQAVLGLDWPEPLLTFALSSGRRSSPVSFDRLGSVPSVPCTC